MKKKILWYSDFLCPTGFGNVAEAIISRLMPECDFTVLAVNYHGEPYNLPDSPYYAFRNLPVYPAEHEGDILGRQKLISLLKTKEFDSLFILQDSFNIATIRDALLDVRRSVNFNYVFYCPVDADLDRDWARTVADADHPVAYTRYGQSKMKEHGYDVPYIYHGVEPLFQPLAPFERDFFRKQYFQTEPGEFLILNVNQNQHRKDLPRTIMAFVEIQKDIPEAKLMLHTNLNYNPSLGHDLKAFIRRYVPKPIQKKIVLPRQSVPRAVLQQLYASSDVVVSTSRGEGWGLSCTEAMACGTPVVMPRHTSFEEIVGEDRGLLVECSEVDVNPLDNNRIRPVVNMADLAAKVRSVYANPEAAKERATAASAWVKEHCDWDKIALQWKEQLDL